jgi:hypothetical protein
MGGREGGREGWGGGSVVGWWGGGSEVAAWGS